MQTGQDIISYDIEDIISCLYWFFSEAHTYTIMIWPEKRLVVEKIISRFIVPYNEKRHCYFLMGFARAIMAYIDNIDQEGLSVQAKRRSQHCVQDDLLFSFKDASTSHMKAEKFAFTFQMLYRSDSEHLRNTTLE